MSDTTNELRGRPGRFVKRRWKAAGKPGPLKDFAIKLHEQGEPSAARWILKGDEERARHADARKRKRGWSVVNGKLTFARSPSGARRKSKAKVAK